MKPIILLITLLLDGCCSRFAVIQPTVTAARVAKVPAGNVSAVRELCAGLDLSAGRGGFYLRDIEGESYLFQYLESGGSDVLESFQGLEELLEPLPVAAFNHRTFEPMERLFYEAGVAGEKPEGDVIRIAMFTGLKPEKEKDYRLLHDNPWPDVVAAIHRANFRKFSIFLEEINGKLYLFGWLEYIGADIAADDFINKKDPASIRWWKETDACQIAPPDANGGMWGGLDELMFVE